MKGQPEIIKLLNKVLTNELTAINQYFLHARIIENWGLYHLGRIVYKESIEEMKHADLLIKRVLFLDGLPNLQDLHKLRIGETITECLEADLGVEVRGHGVLVDGVKYCEEHRDYVTRELLKRILEDTEHHIDFLETQLNLIKMMGEPNYIQSGMKEIEGE
ncbi:bacterioferritin [Asticcacaulis biprosthecium C19]|uniref:Bacterioferritin n=1 Tax=Asticcacaulis biprosthecium C19 TaxID=715226 RepID=F4QP85_9CAUL|nr:bacterioferritin [Asticcacaulis biprosthecium]EGF91143.1 bacterioferritin [Asticcacaulis biprosthecium C19]